MKGRECHASKFRLNSAGSRELSKKIERFEQGVEVIGLSYG